MKKWRIGGGFALVVVFTAIWFYNQSNGTKPASASQGQTKRIMPVILGKAIQKSVDLRVDALGNVQPLATAIIRARVDSEITEVLINEGADVQAGQTLFKLDARAIDAQLAQALASLNKDKALAVQAQKNLTRAQDLMAKSAGTQKTLDDAKGTYDAALATVKSDEAAIDSLKVQLSYYTIKAPISGRVGTISQKIGNIARASEAATALTTINQIKPIYIAFNLPQRYFADLNAAMKAGTAKVEASVQASTTVFNGKIAFIDNNVDAGTGTLQVRAQMNNDDEALWPGAICNTRLIFKTEANALTVPRESVQTGQDGTFIFVADGNIAKLRPIVINRMVDKDAVIATGLKQNDVIVIDGQNQLVDGSQIESKNVESKTPDIKGLK